MINLQNRSFLTNKHCKNNISAFTIVELLVVIVIIGILAAITIVSYSGISSKAIAVSLQSDLDSSKKLLALYNVDHGYFPSTLDSNYCPATPETDARYCLKPSSGNTLEYTGDGQDYDLTATNTASGQVYEVTPTTSPVVSGGGGGGSVANTFVKAWGGNDYDWGESIIKTTDGGYAITGGTLSYGVGNTDAFIAKYDSSNNLSWLKTLGGSGDDYANLVVQTIDGGYAVVGVTDSYGAGDYDILLVKYDSSGNLSWSKTWGGTNDDVNSSFIQTSDGGFAITGLTQSYGSGNGDVFLLKYDSSGNLSWSKTWGGSGGDTGYSLVQTADGGYALTGSTSSYGTYTSDTFLAKYDSSGNLSWLKTWGGIHYEGGYSLIQTNDDGFAVTGSTDSYGDGGKDVFLAKYNSSGNLSWLKTWGGTGDEYGHLLIQTNDGGYAITGETYSYGAGSSDVFLAKYDTSGNLSWSKTWGGSDYDGGYSLIQASDGGYAVTGETDNYGAGDGDMFIIKYNSSGNINNCLSSMCQNISASVNSQTATVFSPNATVILLSPTVTTPTPTVTTPTPTVTTIVAP